MKKILCSLLLIILNLTACSTNQQTGRLDNPSAVPEKKIDLIDSEVFDYKLGLSLGRNLPAVEVNVISPFSTNEIPERIEKWLSAVDQHGGKVELKLDPTYGEERGVISEAIDLVVLAYDFIKKKTLYDATDNYDVVVYYRPEDGIVTKIVFNIREGIAG